MLKVDVFSRIMGFQEIFWFPIRECVFNASGMAPPSPLVERNV